MCIQLIKTWRLTIAPCLFAIGSEIALDHISIWVFHMILTKSILMFHGFWVILIQSSFKKKDLRHKAICKSSEIVSDDCAQNDWSIVKHGFISETFSALEKRNDGPIDLAIMYQLIIIGLSWVYNVTQRISTYRSCNIFN